MSGSGADRLARRMLKEARALAVPSLPDPDVLAPAPLDFARAAGLEPDAWQRAVLESETRKTLLLCSRQSGKSTVSALLAAQEAAYTPGALVLMLAPSLRQSGELFRTCLGILKRVALPVPAIAAESALRVELDNGARNIALPGSEATTRGYSAATLVVIDEAARVVDELIAAVRPALATTNGRIIALSTPAGRRGWFWQQWTHGEGWERTRIAAADCPRIAAAFLADERQQLGEFVYTQEYECEFIDSDTAVFSSELIARALSDDVRPLWSVT